MAHEAVRPAFEQIEKEPTVPHSTWDPELLTGRLEVRWMIPKDHAVAIGSGWLRVEQGKPTVETTRIGRKTFTQNLPGERFIVSEIVRRGDHQLPVLPGSSIKGAVRQVYELLTPSCSRGVRSPLCKVGARERRGRVCPTCSLFGAAGYGGRLAFGEATPEQGARLTERDVPTAWSKQQPVAGRMRAYDLARDTDRDGNVREEHEKTRAVYGPFRCRVRVVNASQEEMGLLLAALGLEAPSSPGLRLGAKKFHGLGSADPTLLSWVERFPEQRHFVGEEAAGWARPFIKAVLADSDRRRAWKELHEAISAGA